MMKRMPDELELPPSPQPGDPARITEADIVKAKHAFRKVVSAPYKDLLDAESNRDDG